jgi:hypothetical protein
MKHKGTPIIYNEIPRNKNVKLKMQTHWLSLDEEVGNMNFDRKLR